MLHYRKLLSFKGRVHCFSMFKGRVHCFSMQVVMNKCFLLNLEKNLAQIRLILEKNAKNATLIPKNDVSEPKSRKLGYSNNQLKSW